MIDEIIDGFATYDMTDDELANEFFFDFLGGNLALGDIKYNQIDRCTRSSGDITEKFDAILTTDSDVVIVAIKYKAHEKDLEKLITKKHENFKKLFPIYKDYTHHLALASFHINEDLKEKALEQGVIVLQRKGDVVETTTP
ncbi:MAG TPA: hypothetical protein PLV58_09760 [Campylobacterales bacterium]|nr:hypothetical protein [Campylobacterales bacterium]